MKPHGPVFGISGFISDQTRLRSTEYIASTVSRDPCLYQVASWIVTRMDSNQKGSTKPYSLGKQDLLVISLRLRNTSRYRYPKFGFTWSTPSVTLNLWLKEVVTTINDPLVSLSLIFVRVCLGCIRGSCRVRVLRAQ